MKSQVFAAAERVWHIVLRTPIVAAVATTIADRCGASPSEGRWRRMRRGFAEVFAIAALMLSDALWTLPFVGWVLRLLVIELGIGLATAFAVILSVAQTKSEATSRAASGLRRFRWKPS